VVGTVVVVVVVVVVDARERIRPIAFATTSMTVGWIVVLWLCWSKEDLWAGRSRRVALTKTLTINGHEDHNNDSGGGSLIPIFLEDDDSGVVVVVLVVVVSGPFLSLLHHKGW
jgi:hypothetical protein